jgi:hypothetical protein
MCMRSDTNFCICNCICISHAGSVMLYSVMLCYAMYLLQYEYLMSATFGSLAEDAVVRCEIPSHILEPYFGQPPGDLRQLSRTDRTQSQEIVTAGGSRVRQTLFDLRTWYATLAMTVEELQAHAEAEGGGGPCILDDGKTAILMIQPK